MQRLKKISKNLLPYFIIELFIIFPWLLKPGYLFFTDSVWGPNILLSRVFNNWFAFDVLVKILSIIFSIYFIQKIYIGACFLVVLLGAKKIVEHFTGSKRIIFIVSLFALFNPFVYDRAMYGQFGIILSFGFLCFILGYLLEYLRKQERKQIYLAGLFTGLMIQFSPHFIFLGGAFYFIFIITCLKKRFGIKILLQNLFFMGLIALGVNFNLVVGVFFKKSATVNFVQENISSQDLAAFQTSGKTGWEALKNVVMMSGFWGKDQFRYVDLTKVKEGWGRSFFALLPLILLGVYEGLKSVKSKVKSYKVIKFKVKSSNVSSFRDSGFGIRDFCIGLLIIFFIALILAVGIRLPVCRQITYWLFDYFPFYKGMREAQKWVVVIVVIYLIFLAIGVERLFKFKFIEDNKVVASILLAGIIIMQAPLMLWGLGGQVRPTQYPQDWQEVDEFVKSKVYKVHKVESREVCDDKILFLPWHMYMGFSWIGNVVANPAGKFFACPVIQGSNMEWGGIYDNSLDPDGIAIGRWISSLGKEALPDNLDIKYIILAKEVDWKKYSWLDQIEDLVLIKETERLRLYEAK